MKTPNTFQRGVALITVLLITALATIIAVSMASRQQFDTQRTINILEGDQANLLALGIEAWGQEILEKDGRHNKTDHLQEDWAKKLSPIKVENGTVSGKIEDLQARFNLNNLAFLPKPTNEPPANANTLQTNNTKKPAEKDPIAQYQRLLSILGVEENKIEGLANALADWLDRDQKTRFPGGAEDNEYLDQDPPYRTSDILLRSVSELLWVQGYDAKIVERLRPHVTALPIETSVNVNTASAEVLMSLSDNLDDTIANDIIENRGEEGYNSVDNFLQQDFLAGITIPKETVDVSSQHFIVHGAAQFGKIKKQIHSVIVREKARPTQVILRSQGAY